MVPAASVSQRALNPRMQPVKRLDGDAAEHPMPRFLHSRNRIGSRHTRNHILRAVLLVFLPFAFGFFLSHLYRTIPALLSDNLAQRFGLTPADLGFLASTYFLAFGFIQLPLGIWLDRYGPKRVQLVLMSIATLGAGIFALSDSFAGLLIGRTLIGLGVAGALMAGLKAIVLWFPADRLPLSNGIYIMLGGLGAVTATAPLEPLLDNFGWRGLCLILTAVTGTSVLVIFMLVPDRRSDMATNSGPTTTLMAIYKDRRFWRIAPLSGTIIGSAWALQGLWAAPWLADVEGFQRDTVIAHLFAMATALAAGALFMGLAADRLKRFGLSTAEVFAGAAVLSILGQLTLILRLPVPPMLPWILIGALGSGTALSYASLSETFPKSASARANGALNVLHVTFAFAVQATLGVIVELWPETNGRYPVVAYQAAFGANLAVQLLALTWFFVPVSRTRSKVFVSAHRQAAQTSPSSQVSPSAYDRAAENWNTQMRVALQQCQLWRNAACAASALVVALGAATLTIAHRPGVNVVILQTAG